jgi:hypothetical protein
MRLSEKLSGIIFRQVAKPYLKSFEKRSLEPVLKRSLKVLDTSALVSLKEFVRSKQTSSGGFMDKAGKPDIYYSLFGYFLAGALKMNDMVSSLKPWVESQTRKDNLSGVHLNCAAILYSRLGTDKSVMDSLALRVRKSIESQLDQQSAYSVFLNLLTCYYIEDYKGLYQIMKRLKSFTNYNSLPCPVVSALLVLQTSFNKRADDLKEEILSFYNNNGGFKATHQAPVPDLLSTAVALFSLAFAGNDFWLIKPDCLDFIDSMYNDGGFAGNIIDIDPDIEYTFYGLLAMGALTD